MTEDEIIEKIIDSFTKFAFHDIRHNIPKNPISAFILCTCLIDQLSAFRYNPKKWGENKIFYNKFIEDYLPQYKAFDLYNNLRCNLVHNYTISKYIRITSDPGTEFIVNDTEQEIITAQSMYNSLAIAFNNLCVELRSTDSDSRKNALARYTDSNIISGIQHHFVTFTEEETAKMVDHYKPLLIGKTIEGTKKITDVIYKEHPQAGSYLPFAIVNEELYILDDLIISLGYPPLKEFSASLDDSQNNTRS